MRNQKNNYDNEKIAGIAITILTLAVIMMPTVTLAQESFTSEEDNFSLQVPEGWVIQDHDNVSYEGYSEENVALLCPANEALPGIGGEFNCLAANTTDAIFISKVPDLQAVPEFADLTEPPTTNDLVGLTIQTLQQGNQTSNIQIQNNTDIDEFRKIVNMTMTRYSDAGTFFNFDDYDYNTKTLQMFVLSPDRNTGYQIFNTIATPNAFNVTEHSPAVEQVFNSFQVVN